MRRSLLEFAVEAVSHLAAAMPPGEHGVRGPDDANAGSPTAPWRRGPAGNGSAGNEPAGNGPTGNGSQGVASRRRHGLLFGAPQLPAVTFAMLIDVDAALV